MKQPPALHLWLAILFLNLPIVSLSLRAQSTPLTVTSGFNQDLVASASTPATTSLDGLGNVFVDASYLEANSDPLQGAFPAGQSVTGASGTTYELAPPRQLDALLLSGSSSGTLSFDPIAGYNSVEILGTSSFSPAGTFSINYSDGSDEIGTYQLPDWYSGNTFNGSPVVQEIGGFVRAKNGSLDTLYGDTFGLYELAVPVEAIKTIDSISFQQSEGKTTAIFAVSASLDDVEEPNVPVLLIKSAALLTIAGRAKDALGIN